jgi:hypothetical protein
MLEARGVDNVPEVVLLNSEDAKRATHLRREGVVALRKSEVLPLSSSQRRTSADAERASLAERKAIAVAQILEAWGLLKDLTHKEQEQLVREIVEVVLFVRGE